MQTELLKYNICPFLILLDLMYNLKHIVNMKICITSVKLLTREAADALITFLKPSLSFLLPADKNHAG